jgi:DNA-binding CsgD family transcriptional regulator
MNHPILEENVQKRLTVGLPLLFCFALYPVWQMGVVYFSGEALSLGGRTPVPVDNMTALITAGYALSIGFAIAAPKFAVWAERLCALSALGAALLLYLPLAPGALAIIYYLHCFFCVFMIVFENAVIANLFTEETAILHLTVPYALASALIAVLQNDLVAIPFWVFHMVIIATLVLQLIFYFKLPSKQWPRYAKKADGLVLPGRLFAGLSGLAALSCFMILFGITVAESILHGVTVLFLSMALSGLGVFALWKLFGITPLRICTIMVCVDAFGFIMAIASFVYPSLSLAVCVLLGLGSAVYLAVPYFALVMVKRYPSRFISPGIIAIAMLAVLVHSALLEAFRNRVQALYVLYLVIAVGMVVLYLILEPYLIYSFRGRSLLEEVPEGRREQEEKDAVLPGALFTRQPPWKPGELAAFDCLTKKELEVTELMLRGLSAKEIAAQMKVSGSTIATHRKAVYDKLNVHSKGELFALERRIREKTLPRSESTPPPAGQGKRLLLRKPV